METATLDLTQSRKELGGKSKILPVGQKDHEILEFLLPSFLKRKMFSSLGSRYYSVSSDWEKEVSKDLESKKAVWRKHCNQKKKRRPLRELVCSHCKQSKLRFSEREGCVAESACMRVTPALFLIIGMQVPGPSFQDSCQQGLPW